MTAIQLYTGVCEKAWNYSPVQPFGFACISPVKGKSERTKAANSVFVPDGTRVIQDSGAFSDSFSGRLTFQQALDRQRRHADQYAYADMIEAWATYDVLIDEVWQDGERSKRRWTLSAAEEAVEATVAAAQFANKNRDAKPLIISAQGVDGEQYERCTRRLLTYFRDGDILGLGGWCIIGKLPAQMRPVFRDTILRVIPLAARAGIRRVHIWGVIYPRALGELLYICDEHGIAVSTDSAGVSLKPCFGDWGYGEWRDNTYKRPPVETRGAERTRHVAKTRAWLADFRRTIWYHDVDLPMRQLEMFIA